MDFICFHGIHSGKACFTGMCRTNRNVVYQTIVSAMKASTIVPTDSKRKKETTYIKLSSQIKEEFAMWIYLFQSNKGSPWRTYDTILVEADISSDASGRQFAGIVDFQQGPTLITAGNFEEHILEQDIQVKEGVALKQTLLMLLQQAPERIKGKTLICKVDNLVVKDVIERKGTSANLILTNVGKEMFWIQQVGDFHMLLSYVSSQENKADEFTQHQSSLEK